MVMVYSIRTLKRIYRILISAIASVCYGFPMRNLKVIGVTGTSGKTTTTTLIYEMLKNLGFKVGIISTVEARAGNTVIDTGLHVTTPDPIELQRIVAKMRKEKIEYLVCECSSHSLDQGRLGLTKFDIAVFTNIKRDHLDYHFTWENYARAKARLILKTKENGSVVLNGDDESFNFLAKYIRDHVKNTIKIVSYSKNEVESIQVKPFVNFIYKGVCFNVPILGDYNVYNILAACKVGEILGIDIQSISNSLLNFTGVLGRMQIMKKDPFIVIVDFAHNADSLEKSLNYVRNNLLVGNGKIINVFGSAGLRDVEKRYTMGEVSGKLADITIVTAEDPRTESLYAINTAIISGAEKSGAKLIKRFANSLEFNKEYNDNLKTLARSSKTIFSFDEENVNSRYDAIKFAILIAEKNDIVITQGKGHEKSLCFGTVEYPFTDQDAVNKALLQTGN
ncbi:MAG: UDP-N-acetylmuramyl-tripeptide synthetase [Candidatus Dojkabacteria bacterium]|nr:UDP-N-acetylmuramyl-tripeptide synthetase [Candidatus Dojkabacteria bacterium]